MRWPFQDREEWHRWFAWHPVVMDGRWVWLEVIERRKHEPLVWSDWMEYREIAE